MDAIARAEQFSPDLFTGFVAWIDRGEKTARSYLTNLKQFAAWLKYAGVEQPRREDIILYREWLAAEHEAITLTRSGWMYRTDASGRPIKIVCKPNTIAQYLRSVCQFFRWTAAQGLYPDIAANIHAPKVSHDTHRKEALTPAEVLRVENAISETAQEAQKAASEAAKDQQGKIQRCTEQGKRLFAIYTLAVNAGLRTIEISRACIKDFETKGGQAWLYIWGKGHTEADQRKPLAPEVAEAIKDYLAARKDHYTGASPLFVATGNRSGGKRLDPTTISRMLKSALKSAGFDSARITAHSLRHTAGTAVQEITGNLYETQLYMRHANPATTEIYLHNDTTKAEAGIAQRLYNLYHGGREQLTDIISRLTPAQQAQLAEIAQKMA